MSRPRISEGFTTIELLISLFVAAAFIATAFQLFSVVVQDSNDSRLRSRAGNIAYENIRLYSSLATNPCTTVSSVTPAAPADLPRAVITVSFSCPYGTSSRTSRIKVSVNYNASQPIVEEALDVIR